jgi:cell division protein FtsL
MAEAIYKPIVISGEGSSAETMVQPKGVNRNLFVVAMGVAFVFVGCSLFYVWAHHQVISLGYEISQANHEEQALVQENQKLRLELAALKNPRRIEGMAFKELGFINPKKEQLIIVR